MTRGLFEDSLKRVREEIVGEITEKTLRGIPKIFIEGIFEKNLNKFSVVILKQIFK